MDVYKNAADDQDLDTKIEAEIKDAPDDEKEK